MGILQADAYAGFNPLYAPGRVPGPVTEPLCWSHGRRKSYELADIATHKRHARPAAPIARLGTHAAATDRRWRVRAAHAGNSSAGLGCCSGRATLQPCRLVVTFMVRAQQRKLGKTMATLASVLTDIASAVGQSHMDIHHNQIDNFRRQVEEPDVRLGELSVPAAAMAVREYMAPKSAEVRVSLALSQHHYDEEVGKVGAKLAGEIKGGLPGIGRAGGSIGAEIVRQNKERRRTDHRATADVTMTFQAVPAPPGVLALVDYANRLAAIENNAVIEEKAELSVGHDRRSG